MKKLLLLFAAFAFNINASAHMSNSGPFSLPGGVVPPKGQYAGHLNISLKSLPPSIFDITCDIENPNYNKPYPVVLELYGSLNGITSQTNLYLLDHEINKYATRVRMDGHRDYLTFSNLDTTDSVYVKNCIAVYATS